MNYIPRQIEDIVRRSAATFKCVLVTGARQTGKSTLLRELFPDKKYLSFDDPFLEDQANENPHSFLMLNPPPIVLDEVQRSPSLFRYIKILCDESSDCGLFFLSGSESLELMRNVSESLCGRISVMELSGLSLREIQRCSFADPFIPTIEYMKKRGVSAKQPENIWAVIHRGSFPELQDNSVDWAAFYAGYVKTYLECDVREYSAVHDLNDFRRFMIAAAARTGQMLNVANIANEVGKDAVTIRRWLSVLEASGIIYLLKPYMNSVLNRAIKTPKLYFRDTGLAAYLTRWLTPETLAYGAMSGAFFETFVVSEIIKSYSNRGIDYRYCVSYYRGRDKKKVNRNGETRELDSEIDLIIEENGVLYPIEIKQSSNVTEDDASAFTVLEKITDKKSGTGGIICMCPQPGVLRDNLLSIPVWYL